MFTCGICLLSSVHTPPISAADIRELRFVALPLQPRVHRLGLSGRRDFWVAEQNARHPILLLPSRRLEDMNASK